ncbi:hypothetical protein JR316_0005405 [Psilocybe cubensis]|uniref:Uncharacterized protein n=2 Tax=Psilocybe cubensis TaxID=181762 RepID=A0ACB8H6E8_PSICU|nr:hypothetical protein JR316_0005405 [Psilocybe cubensis]KAH9483299.1 hypothetical protein JR316_0005405 [Psilocybe cubensis]
MSPTSSTSTSTTAVMTPRKLQSEYNRTMTMAHNGTISPPIPNSLLSEGDTRNPTLRIIHSPPHTPPRKVCLPTNAAPGPGPTRRQRHHHPILRTQIPNSAAPQPHTYSPTTPLQNTSSTTNAPTSTSTSATAGPLDKAFSVHASRMRADLSEIRAVCMALFMHEQEEKRRLHEVCVRVMRERDVARAKVGELMRGQQTGQVNFSHSGVSNISSMSRDGSPSSPNANVDADVSAVRGGKRTRDADITPSGSSTGMENRSPGSISRSPRTVRPLRKSSPPLSPLQGIQSPELQHFASPPPPLSSVSNGSGTGTAPPNSALSDDSSSASSSGFSSQSRSRSNSYDDLSSTSSSSSASASAMYPYASVKRRKSCDGAIHVHTETLLPPVQSLLMQSDASPHNYNEGAMPRSLNSNTAPHVLKGTFPHVDIMYLPVDGGLVCRACLLDASKSKGTTTLGTRSPQSKGTASASPSPGGSPNLNAKHAATTFPATASWDTLRDHCVFAHPNECADVQRLHPAEIFELRRRLRM